MKIKLNTRRNTKSGALAMMAFVSIALLSGCAKSADTTGASASGGMKEETISAPAVSEEPSGEIQSNAAESTKLKVVASFYPMYDFAVKIGGDKAEVTDMVPAGTEPHDWEPSVADIKNLEEADLFVYSGAGMEHWADDVLRSLENSKLVTVEASGGLTLRAGSSHEGEHDHGQYDPHVWLSPVNAKKEMENIKDGYVKADPDNRDYYEANYKTYAAKFDELDQEYKDTLSALPNKDIVVSHEAFGYLCDAYGLNQVGIEGMSPDSEPDPARMADIIDFVKENNVKVIFFEEMVSPKVAETIASETGAKTEVLNPLEGLSDEELKNGEDYFSVMESNRKKLVEALQ